MNLLLLEPSDRIPTGVENRFEVRDRRADHLRNVLAVHVGDTVRVGLLNGPHGTGTVVEVGEKRIELSCRFEPRPSERPRFDLVLAVPRPKSLRKLLPEVAAFGVDRIVLLRTWRVAKPFLSASILQEKEYRPLLREGMMQGRLTHEPEVLLEPLFKPFVEDRAEELFANANHRIIAHPTAERCIAELTMGSEDRVVAVIGPEGGLLSYEVEALMNRGFLAVRMGPTPLRVETACVALMAQIELLRMLNANVPLQS